MEPITVTLGALFLVSGGVFILSRSGSSDDESTGETSIPFTPTHRDPLDDSLLTDPVTLEIRGANKIIRMQVNRWNRITYLHHGPSAFPLLRNRSHPSDYQYHIDDGEGMDVFYIAALYMLLDDPQFGGYDAMESAYQADFGGGEFGGAGASGDFDVPTEPEEVD
ncbi:MAG: hypothetical protein OEM02_03725, partial [Desulfobulbaceae bacterium]|nr:hypothetical protein [Desulfobulbaceae bacterium]